MKIKDYFICSCCGKAVDEITPHPSSPEPLCEECGERHARAKNAVATLPQKRFHVPETILVALARQRTRHSNLVHVFHCIYLGEQKWIGVAGDGDNGAYEYFVMQKGNFTCSDVGYGDTTKALRDILEKEPAT